MTPLGLGVPSVLASSVSLSFASVDLTGVTDLSRGFEVCFINLGGQQILMYYNNKHYPTFFNLQLFETPDNLNQKLFSLLSQTLHFFKVIFISCGGLKIQDSTV